MVKLNVILKIQRKLLNGEHNISKFIKELKSELTKTSKPANKVWQESYMKGVIPFHGVKVPQVRILAKSLTKEHNLKTWEEQSLYELVKQLLAAEFSEEKLCGILVLSSKDLDLQDWEEQLRFIKASFQTEQIADSATCDQVKTVITVGI